MIHTLLDNDFYQFTMANLLWQTNHAEKIVKYSFRNRTFAVPLASRIDLGELREHIENIRLLTFTEREIDYLRGLGYFTDSFLAALTHLKLPEVEIADEDGHLVLNYEGPWADAIFWETPLLSLVNELYFREFGIACHREGNLRLREKMDYLAERGTIQFFEFGTRRRFSAQWQQHVLHRLLNEVPHLVLGTSNVHLARAEGISPVGTMAHQLFMVRAALEYKNVRETHEVPEISQPREAVSRSTEWVLTEWAKLYAPNLMTVLPDTFGTYAFFDTMTRWNDQDFEWGAVPVLKYYRTFRQDSGDPLVFGNEILRNYSLATQLDPAILTIVFSDSLDVRRMSVIEDEFRGKCKTLFGWGTNLTNDLGLEPLSIVIKPELVDGEPCIKISDDTAKATGDPATVAVYRKSFETF